MQNPGTTPMVTTRAGRVKPDLAGVALTAVVAGVVFWLAYDGGSYGLESRATAAIALWWTAVIALVLGLWPLVRPPRAAFVAGGLLAAFCAWTGLSAIWASSAERAFTELNRVSLFLAVFVVAVLASSRGNLTRWCDGLALSTSAIGVLALASRLFDPTAHPGPFEDPRLRWPPEYWNGLAILVALGLPLLLRLATDGRRGLSRAVAVGAFPALAGTLYLTSSRGGFATAAIGLLVFVVLTPRRWAAAGSLALGLVGSGLAVAVLLARDELANDPFEAAEAVGQGRSAALLIVLVCVSTGLLFWLGTRFLSQLRPPPALGIAAAVLVAAVLAGAVVAAHPVRRFEQFKTMPAAYEEQDFVQAHLLSASGNGRWQWWGSAVDEWESRRVVGRGAGSFESWWAQRATFSQFVRDAHSLYLETLGELGLVGLVLLLGALGTGVVAGAARLRAAEGEERVAIAALLSLFAAYLVAAGVDWIWELTVVTVVAMAALGLLTGPATATLGRLEVAAGRGDGERGRRLAVGLAAILAGWFLILAQAVPFLSNLEISRSQAAVRAGDADAALDRADAARELQPWAASPYLQLALVREATDDLAGAREAIEQAIDRDPLDWRLWLVRTRLETKDGAIAEARRSLARAVELNPRSPLFAQAQ
jgi:O-antigen ligase